MNIHALGRDPPCPCHTATPKRYLLSARVTTASSASFRDHSKISSITWDDFSHKELKKRRYRDEMKLSYMSIEKALENNELLKKLGRNITKTHRALDQELELVGPLSSLAILLGRYSCH